MADVKLKFNDETWLIFILSESQYDLNNNNLLFKRAFPLQKQLFAEQ